MPASRRLPRIHTILCQPRHAGNIGAVARIMANLGYSRLSLVDPTARCHLEAVRMAVGAAKIIERADVPKDLETALAGAARSYAVTRRPRKIYKKILVPEQAAQEIASLGSTEVAVVFGSEKLGLSTEQTRLCDTIITIPSSQSAPSLNLAQAAALVLYQCSQSDLGGLSPEPEAQQASTSKARRILYERMERTLKLSGYFRTKGAAQTMADIEDIFNRSSLSRRDVDLLLGMFRRIEAAVDNQDRPEEKDLS